MRLCKEERVSRKSTRNRHGSQIQEKFLILIEENCPPARKTMQNCSCSPQMCISMRIRGGGGCKLQYCLPDSGGGLSSRFQLPIHAFVSNPIFILNFQISKSHMKLNCRFPTAFKSEYFYLPLSPPYPNFTSDCALFFISPLIFTGLYPPSVFVLWGNVGWSSDAVFA